MPHDLPPKDQNGLTIPHDCQEILPEHRVIRRISQEWIVTDTDGRRRVSTAAFDPSSKEHDPYCGLSVDIERFIIDDGLDAQTYVSTPQFTGAIAIAVSNFRTRSFLAGYDPYDDNPYHGAVWGDESRNSRFTRGTKKAFLKESEWFVPIKGVEIV